MNRVYLSLFIAIALTGWIVFQLLFRKKKINQLKYEIGFTLLFIVSWAAIFYWVLH